MTNGNIQQDTDNATGFDSSDVLSDIDLATLLQSQNLTTEEWEALPLSEKLLLIFDCDSLWA